MLLKKFLKAFTQMLKRGCWENLRKNAGLSKFPRAKEVWLVAPNRQM